MLVYGFTGVQLALFILFYPVLTGATVSVEFSLRFLKWMQTWPWG